MTALQLQPLEKLRAKYCLPDEARWLDDVVIGDHVPIGGMAVAQNIIVQREWWQIWKPRLRVEQRMCLCLADRSALDVTLLMR